MSTLQRPVLHLDVFRPQRSELHRNLHHCMDNRSLCCSWSCTWICLDNRSLSCSGTCIWDRNHCCSWTCLHYRGLCCTWTFLHHKGLSCTWTSGLQELCFSWTCLYTCTRGARAALGSVYATRACTWTCLHYRGTCMCLFHRSLSCTWTPYMLLPLPPFHFTPLNGSSHEMNIFYYFDPENAYRNKLYYEGPIL